MVADPMHPVSDAEELARSLTDADLTGVGETPPVSPFTVGSASKAKAFARATAPGDPMRGSTLVEVYRRWSAQQAAATKSAPAAEDAERKAMRKSAKRLGKCLKEGMAPAAAVAQAHAHYRKHGGRSTLPVWARRVSGGA